jgi:hypothetical protein
VTLNTDVGWEILLNEYTETDVAQLPFVVDVNCTFKPIMKILPRKESKDNPYVPLIANTPSNYTETILQDLTNSAVNKPQPANSLETLLSNNAFQQKTIAARNELAFNSTQPAAAGSIETNRRSNLIDKTSTGLVTPF